MQREEWMTERVPDFAPNLHHPSECLGSETAC